MSFGTIPLSLDDKPDGFVLLSMYEKLESENAKLRELVRDMFGGYKGAVKMLPSSYSKNVAERAVMDISDRMRELGIEVEQ